MIFLKGENREFCVFLLVIAGLEVVGGTVERPGLNPAASPWLPLSKNKVGDSLTLL